MPVLSHLHQLFSAEPCQAYVHRIGKCIFPVPEVPVLKDERGG